MIRLYHTSNVEICTPDVLHSRNHLDFGRGFYLTSLRDQAEKYGQRFLRKGETAVMNIYELNDESLQEFSRIVFEAYDRGDTVAEKIISDNMAEIANLISSASADFDDVSSPIKVVFVGGLTARSDVLFTHIRSHLKNNSRFHLSVYPFEPVLGALKTAGAPVDTQNDNGITRE